MEQSWNSSYGYGFDEINHWGNRYFFTYYTTLGSRSDWSLAFEIIIFAVIICLSLIGNVAIIAAILRRRDSQPATNSFIVNLACADLVFVLGIPAIAGARASSAWELGTITCKLVPYSQLICGSVLLWTMTGISVDRFCCLSSSPYRSGLTQRTALISSVAMWVIGFIIYLPIVIFFREQTIQQNTTSIINNTEIVSSMNVTICTMVFPAMTSVNTALAFMIPIIVISSVIPMCILVYNYQIILRKLAEIQRRLENKVGFPSGSSKLRSSVQTIAENIFPNYQPTSSVEASSPVVKYSSISSMNRLKKHKRAVRNLYVNVIALLIMWLPITVVMFLIYFDGHRNRNDTNFFLRTEHFVWSVILALSNTIVNPFLYGFLTENFRGNEISYLFSRYCWPRNNVVDINEQNTSGLSKKSSSNVR